MIIYIYIHKLPVDTALILVLYVNHSYIITITQSLLHNHYYTYTQTYFNHRSLTIFTTYEYRVTARNDFGVALSLPSEEVTTFGGIPKVSPNITVYALNHTALDLRWTIPS